MNEETGGTIPPHIGGEADHVLARISRGSSGVAEFVTAGLNAMQGALIEYREHREHGPHVNYEGQAPEDRDEYDSCARCVSTAQATPYRDVAFGLADVEAKRQTLAEHHPVTFTDVDLGIVGAEVCSVCHGRLDYPDDLDDDAADAWTYPLVQAAYPCRTVRLLASSVVGGTKAAG